MRATLLAVLLGGCGDDGSGGDADADSDVDADSDSDSDSDTDGPECSADCESLNVSDLPAEEQTPENITMEPTCEPGAFTKTLENVVDDAGGLPLGWTELRTYDRPDKPGGRHEIRTDYEVGSRCSDGRIEALDAEMHSLRPIFRATCGGVYCFEGL